MDAVNKYNSFMDRLTTDEQSSGQDLCLEAQKMAETDSCQDESATKPADGAANCYF